jgi:hypothetical protein
LEKQERASMQAAILHMVARSMRGCFWLLRDNAAQRRGAMQLALTHSSRSTRRTMLRKWLGLSRHLRTVSDSERRTTLARDKAICIWVLSHWRLASEVKKRQKRLSYVAYSRWRAGVLAVALTGWRAVVARIAEEKKAVEV